MSVSLYNTKIFQGEALLTKDYAQWPKQLPVRTYDSYFKLYTNCGTGPTSPWNGRPGMTGVLAAFNS